MLLSLINLSEVGFYRTRSSYLSLGDIPKVGLRFINVLLIVSFVESRTEKLTLIRLILSLKTNFDNVDFPLREEIILDWFFVCRIDYLGK